MRTSLAILVGALLALAGCSGGDDTTTPVDDAGSEPVVRFCDAYLDYLSDPTLANLDRVAAASDDPEVNRLAEIVRDDARTGRVVAADADLEDLARARCQVEWTAGAQGAGNTAAAAEAFLDALVAGDRFGARNIAAANAIAVFEPWEAIEEGAPTLVDVEAGSFVIVLGPASLAECQVETGVVLACLLVE